MPARHLVKHPENISFGVAAASWMQYVTAWGALIEQAKLSTADFVIVTAASSSVGIAAFQIAKAVGATIIATTRTRAKRQALMEHGADHVVVTDEEDLVARVMELTSGVGARVVFDPVGGPSFIPLTESMARGGILLEYGALSTELTPFSSVHRTRQELDVEGLSEWRDHKQQAALRKIANVMSARTQVKCRVRNETSLVLAWDNASCWYPRNAILTNTNTAA